MRLPITVLIPVVLVVLSLTVSLVMFFHTVDSADHQIREDAKFHMIHDITRLQNILYNNLTDGNLQEARLNISVTAMNPSINSIILTNENHEILIASRYLWKGSVANKVSQYDIGTAQKIREFNQSDVHFRTDNNKVLNGYFPVILELESERGLPIKRVGVLFVESSIESRLLAARKNAVDYSIVFAGLMLLISVLLAIVLHLLVSRRLLKLTAASRALSAGNLEVRTLIGGNDELADLGKSFDEMVERIKSDILFREKAKSELRELNETLEQRIEERTALLGEAQRVARLGNWSWDVVSDKVKWSDEVFSIFDYESGSIEPTLELFYSLIHLDDVELSKQLEEQALSGISGSQDLRITTIGGQLRWIHYEIMSIKDDEGSVAELRGIVQDITERKIEMENREQLEKQLLQSQKMESLGQLTGGIAHDFNNILASIIGFTALTQKLDIEDPKGKLPEYLDQIAEAGNRGKKLVQQMLAFGRTSEGVKDKENVVVKDILNETLSLLIPILPSSIEVNLNVSDEGSTIRADVDMLGQVITNLCVNARDSIEGQQGKIDVNVKETRIEDKVCSSCHNTFSGSYIEISIEDTGEGIKEEILDRLFDPFFSTKSVTKGSGMGLSMVHGILHKHEGHIIVKSKPGFGSRFQCFFPMSGLDETKRDGLVDGAHEVDEAGDGQHILVIDDELPLTNFFNDLLTDYGYRVTTMNDSGQALEFLKGFGAKVDLVLTDQTMPGLTGVQISKKMLTIDPSIPIVICTGYSEMISGQLDSQVNIKGILDKPVDVDKLLEILKTTLSDRTHGQTKASN